MPFLAFCPECIGSGSCSRPQLPVPRLLVCVRRGIINCYSDDISIYLGGFDHLVGWALLRYLARGYPVT